MIKDTQLQIRIDKKTKAWLRKEADRLKMNVSELVMGLISYQRGKPVDLKNGFKVQKI